MVRVDFGSIEFFVQQACHAKTSNFIGNFESVMDRFGSIQISGPLSVEHILDFVLGMSSDHSVRVQVRVSGLESVLSGLVVSIMLLMFTKNQI